MFNSKKIIFDVGAYDGADGLMLALKNPYCLIYAFEANPEQYKIINNNKNILEKRIGKKINNYKVFNFAISNIKKNVFFIFQKTQQCHRLIITEKMFLKVGLATRSILLLKKK